MSENLDKFLEELAELSVKYGFAIGGCGCCGSPYIETLSGREVARDLTFYNGEYVVSRNEESCYEYD